LFASGPFLSAQKLRQIGDIRRYPPRLIFHDEIARNSVRSRLQKIRDVGDWRWLDTSRQLIAADLVNPADCEAEHERD
jgi:hypothetical protein